MPPITLTATSLLALLLACAGARAQAPGGDCTGLADDAVRLACYDRLHGRALPGAAPPAALPAAAVAASATPGPEQPRSHLARRWDLDGQAGSLFTPRPYKPVYLLPVTWTDHVNLRPSSPSPDHSVPFDLDLRAYEVQYQLSLKAKFAQNLFGTPLSLWGGYTQSSRWQVYDSAASRPFRETNYEPELMLVTPLNAELLGWQFRTASLSLNHQSNGRSLPLSRSWNRVIASVTAERGEWIAEFRPWARFNESAGDDDNPDIEDHVGRAELLVSRYWGDQALTLQLRHSLRSGDNARGSAQVDWVFPLTGALHGYLQAFSGYGESLIDYNLKQNKIGLGLTIAGWR